MGAQVNKRLNELSEKNWDPVPVANVEMTSKLFSLNPPCSIHTLGQITMSTSRCSMLIEETTFKLGKPITLQTRTSKHKNSQPRFSVLHGLRRVDIPQPPMIIAGEAEMGSFLVTFIPVVSGEHVIIVEGKNWSSEYTLTVTGEPSIGARVQRGPDWIYSDKDGGKGSLGTVLCRSVAKEHFDINWEVSNKSYCCKLGRYKKYDFQLVL